MRIAIDFDGTIVSESHPYDDLTTPLEFLPGALKGLYSLKAAEHTLILYSGRANLSLREDWKLNPLNAEHILNLNKWEKNQVINRARYQQMLSFTAEHLPGIFSYVDDGRQGKVGADLFIDNRAFGTSVIDWPLIIDTYGSPLS